MKFLLLLAQQHEDFRENELMAIADMHRMKLDLQNYSPDSPLLELDLESEDEAQKLVSRSILSRAIFKVYSHGSTYEEVHAQNRQNLAQFRELRGKSFKLDFSSYMSSRPRASQLEEINKCRYLDLDGPIRMKNPEVELVFVERYDSEGSHELQELWFTRLVAHSDRKSVDVYNLKKRRHVGTTSFDAELALVTTNMAQIRRGDFVYDPFSGTGSFPLAAAHQGAYVWASDIDVRPLIKYNLNFEQYHTEAKFIGSFEMDFTHNAFHERLKFDAIICDPPYGVRERIVVCGAAKPERFVGHEHVMVGDELSHRRRDYVATKKPYELSMMLNDLFEFAAARLNVGRRLAFWLPLEESEVENVEIPLHRNLEFKSVSVQKFGKWERWLLTYERREHGDEGPSVPLKLDDDFRTKYINRYKN